MPLPSFSPASLSATGASKDIIINIAWAVHLAPVAVSKGASNTHTHEIKRRRRRRQVAAPAGASIRRAAFNSRAMPTWCCVFDSLILALESVNTQTRHYVFHQAHSIAHSKQRLSLSRLWLQLVKVATARWMS